MGSKIVLPSEFTVELDILDSRLLMVQDLICGDISLQSSVVGIKVDPLSRSGWTFCCLEGSDSILSVAHGIPYVL